MIYASWYILNHPAPKIGGSISPPSGNGFLLLGDGSYLLLGDGASKLKIE